MPERINQIIQKEKCKNPSFFQEPLTIFMSFDIIYEIEDDFAQDGIMVKLVADVRTKLSTQGIILPVVRFRDLEELKPREFIIMTYDNVIYQEDITNEKEISSKYLIEKLEETLRLKDK